MQYFRLGRTSALYSVKIIFSDLYSKVLPKRPGRPVCSEQCLSGLRSLLIVTPKSSSRLTLNVLSYTFYIIELIIATDMQKFTCINIKFHLPTFFDQLTNVSRFDWNYGLSAVVVTLFLTHVSSANSEILLLISYY